MGRRVTDFPSRFPVVTRYVIEGRGGHIQLRYVEFPDGHKGARAKLTSLLNYCLEVATTLASFFRKVAELFITPAPRSDDQA